MGLYRKIEVRIWNDKKFSLLSDDSKLLFLHFLTHPKLLQIGVIPYRPEMVALDLDWTMQRFNKAFEELSRNGMANRSERVIFIKNFLRYNPPANANVVKHYNIELGEVPECELLDDIKKAVIAVCREKGDQYPKILCKSFFDFVEGETVNQTVSQTVSDMVGQTVIETNNNNNNNSNNKKNNNSGLKPDDVTEQTWNDFCQLRKTKKAPITKTAISRIANEATKAGISLEEALSICCERGWQGFKAEWVSGLSLNNGNNQTGPAALDNRKRFADRLIRDDDFCQAFFPGRFDFDNMKEEVFQHLGNQQTFNIYKPYLLRFGLITE